MDPSTMSSPEFQQFLEQEKQKAMMNELVGKLSDVCWDKCITGAPGRKRKSNSAAFVRGYSQGTHLLKAAGERLLVGSGGHRVECSTILG